MVGSDEVKPTTDRPKIMWASFKSKLTGAAGQVWLNFTHNGVEGVAEAFLTDLEEAVKAVLARHEFEL